jgi:hypothetical protein
MNKLDDGFFNRADEHIHLANEQMGKVSMGKVSASMMYSVARFNAYVNSCRWNSQEEMKNARQETITFFVTEYEKMLNENLDDYITNFDKYKNLNG